MDEKIRKQEQVFFEAERIRVPHLFERDPMVDSKEFLHSIGIEIQQEEDLSIGYIRLFPQDFIVEEISRDKELHTVDFESVDQNVPKEGKTFYADLVKIGISTLDAQVQLAEAFGIRPKDIGYAGIKDRLAITSQALSMRNVPDSFVVKDLSAENFFLKHLQDGKGVIANGELQGNRFIITVRCKEAFSSEQIIKIQAKLEEMKKEGFWNFFSFQRFGTPRLLSHKLGLLLMKGDFESAVQLVLYHRSPRELPYFKQIREKIEELWGKWEEIRLLLQPFPSNFPIELSFVEHLISRPKDFLGALHTVPDQVRLWIYAYDSYLSNKKLSQLIKAGEVPLHLPHLTSFNPRDWEPYEEFLKEDGVDIPSRYYKRFPFVHVASRTWSVLQKVEIHNIAFQDKLAVFAFSLPKGAYATSFLMNFFTLASGLPIVSGISREKIDAKKLLGLGSLESTLERFKAVLEERDQDISKDTEV